MKKIRKYILAILLFGTIALLVPACGGGGGGSSGDGESDDNDSTSSLKSESEKIFTNGSTWEATDGSHLYYLSAGGAFSDLWNKRNDAYDSSINGKYSYSRLGENTFSIKISVTKGQDTATNIEGTLFLTGGPYHRDSSYSSTYYAGRFTATYSGGTNGTFSRNQSVIVYVKNAGTS